MNIFKKLLLVFALAAVALPLEAMKRKADDAATEALKNSAGRRAKKQKTEQDDKATQNTAIKNAGVLLYTIRDHKVLVLVGQDIHKGEFGWCDFGGGAKDLNDLKKSAAIEAHEETMGRFYNNTRNPKPEENKKAGVKYFVDRCHDNKCITTVGYQFYVVEVPFIASTDFMETRKALQGNVAHDYLEKGDFAWVDAAEILEKTKGIDAKTPTDIKKDDAKNKVSLTDACNGRTLRHLNRYFIFSMIQLATRKLLRTIIEQAAAETKAPKAQVKNKANTDSDFQFAQMLGHEETEAEMRWVQQRQEQEMIDQDLARLLSEEENAATPASGKKRGRSQSSSSSNQGDDAGCVVM